MTDVASAPAQHFQRSRLDLGGIADFDAASLTAVESVVKSLPVVEHDPFQPVLLPDPNVWAAADDPAAADAGATGSTRAQPGGSGGSAPPAGATRQLVAPAAEMHGRIGCVHWAAPELAAWADVEARPGYNSRKAHEYVDAPDVLAEKVKFLAGLVRSAGQCVAYTGAGISTASGIGDYASRAGNSLAGDQGAPSMLSPLEAQPTHAHCVLTSMHAAGKLARWVQQNHDGLPQKAGCPQSALNEIHVSTKPLSTPPAPALPPSRHRHRLIGGSRLVLFRAPGSTQATRSSRCPESCAPTSSPTCWKSRTPLTWCALTHKCPRTRSPFVRGAYARTRAVAHSSDPVHEKMALITSGCAVSKTGAGARDLAGRDERRPARFDLRRPGGARPRPRVDLSFSISSHWSGHCSGAPASAPSTRMLTSPVRRLPGSQTRRARRRLGQ